jgi:hypothetical protein
MWWTMHITRSTGKSERQVRRMLLVDCCSGHDEAVLGPSGLATVWSWHTVAQLREGVRPDQGRGELQVLSRECVSWIAATDALLSW